MKICGEDDDGRITHAECEGVVRYRVVVGVGRLHYHPLALQSPVREVEFVAAAAPCALVSSLQVGTDEAVAERVIDGPRCVARARERRSSIASCALGRVEEWFEVLVARYDRLVVLERGLIRPRARWLAAVPIARAHGFGRTEGVVSIRERESVGEEDQGGGRELGHGCWELAAYM